MKKLFSWSLPFFLYLIYGIGLGWFDHSIFKSSLERQNPAGYYDYKGVTHVHSILSTGSGTEAEIVEAARESNLDFIILTDLNVFESEKFDEGYRDSLLLINGGEYSYLDSHLLYYGEKKSDPGEESQTLSGIGQAQLFFADMLSQKRSEVSQRGSDLGFVVVAHPLKSRYQWTGEFPVGLDGIEVINLSSLWENAWTSSPLSVIWSILIYPFNPHLAMFRLYEEPKEELAIWDRLNRQRPTIGIAGTDATAKAQIFGSHIRFPSYQAMFEIASNHVLLRSELTGTPESDIGKIMTALRNGQFYMSMDILADPKGFLAEIKVDKKSFPIGSRVKLRPGMQLEVNLPYKPEVPFETVVLRDGERFLTSNSQRTVMDVHVTGVYRVMVRIIPTLPLPDGKKWFPWIYTNAFYIE